VTAPNGKGMAAGLAYAGASGLVYGCITVVAKAVDASPLGKATISSLASFLALSWALRGLRFKAADLWRVAVMGLVGGALAPALMLYGLEQANATDAGLLLTLELVATSLLAFAFLRERVGWWAGGGLLALLCASVLVALGDAGGGDGAAHTTWVGVLLVALAAIAWGVDNTVSTTLVGPYTPPQLIAAKSMVGGAALGIGWLAVGGAGPKGWPDWLGLVGLGALGVGASSILFYHALPRIGAARTSAVNVPTSALAAATGGTLLLKEPFGWPTAVALVLVVGGMALLWMEGRKRDAEGKRGVPKARRKGAQA